VDLVLLVSIPVSSQSCLTITALKGRERPYNQWELETSEKLRGVPVHTIVGIGEVLWDMLPTGNQLGGAPANYTVMAGRLGDYAVVLSRIGTDVLGSQALQILRDFPVDCGQIQTDLQQPTGKVTVDFEGGQPSYTIHQPAAWDFLEPTVDWIDTASKADAVCYGSLAQRSAQSRKTIHAMLKTTKPDCLRIFDVNLRAPFYNAEIVRESLQLATVMKMNDAEVPLVMGLIGRTEPFSERDAASVLLEEFPGLSLVAITRGGKGSLLVGHSEWHEHPGVPTTVADTIGAGDAFTAAMTHYLLRGAPLETLNEAGNRWGSYIASQSGAMPEIAEDTLRRIAAEIGG